MRVRDVIDASLDRIVTARLLPRDPHLHQPADSETLGPQRSGSLFSAKDMEIARRIGTEPFAGEPDLWRHAFELVNQFTASSAAINGTATWPLPHCLGPFAPKAGEIYEQLCFAFEQAGLRQVTPPNKLHKASFEVVETLTAKKLPAFYGLYLLSHRAQKNPWDREIDLRLRIDLAVEQRPGGPVASLTMTAAAVSAVTAVETAVASFAATPTSPPPGAGQLLLRDIAHRLGRPAPPP